MDLVSVAKTITTVRQFDTEGRLVKETETVVDDAVWTQPYRLPSPTWVPPTYPSYPYTVWCGTSAVPDAYRS